MNVRLASLKMPVRGDGGPRAGAGRAWVGVLPLLLPLLLAWAPDALAVISRGIDIAADSAGRACVLVEIYPGGNSYTYHLRRYDAVGQVDWGRDLPPGIGGEALAVAPDGNIVVAGRVLLGDEADLWLATYSADGRPLWSRTVDRGYKDHVRNVAVAPDGGIYLVGEPWFGKFSSTGRLLWERSWYYGIQGAATDRDGSLYLAGSRIGKFAPDGRMVWTRRLPAGVGDIADAATAADGSLYTVGTVDTTGLLAYDAQLVKFRPDGTLAWKRNHAGSGGGSDFGNGVAVAPGGTVYVTGSVFEESSQTSDIWMAAYRPSGKLSWSAALDGPNSWADEGRAVAIVPGGAVFTGSRSGRGGRSESLWVGRFQTLTGSSGP